MFKLSKSSDYGLIFMTVLAQQPPQSYQNLNQICQNHHLPYKFLASLATRLKRAGLVDSKEGSGGGYTLSQNPANITLHQIITALDGPLTSITCLNGQSCPHRDSCLHQPLVAKLSSHLHSQLKQHTLADLVHLS